MPSVENKTLDSVSEQMAGMALTSTERNNKQQVEDRERDGSNNSGMEVLPNFPLYFCKMVRLSFHSDFLSNFAYYPTKRIIFDILFPILPP
uniref:Uncharacterized protein n=1 Tax=Meloidogyne incognita TaxID=6306 RepID=A0A914NKK5_MELIC